METTRLPGRSRPCPAAARASILACFALLTSCEVGPNYHSPAPPAGAGVSATALPPRIAGAPGTAGDTQALRIGSDISGAWWTLFRSPELNALIEQALRNNPDLQAAQATLLQAREAVRADQGGLFPTISAAFGALRENSSAAAFGVSGTGTGTTGTGSGGTGSTGTGSIGSGTGVGGFVGSQTGVFNLYNATVNVSYAPDLWGGVRRTIEQARAQAEYERYALEASYLTLTSNIVTAALAEASLRAQIAATEQVVKAEQDALRVVRAQLAAGSVTRSELLQQQAQLESTLATLPTLQSQLAQERNLIATYLGVFPNQFHDPDFDLSRLQLPTDLPVSLPSALVAQRPDIQQAAATLHARTAAVGIATANLLPQITLSGSVGTDALQIGQLFGPGSLAYSLGAQLTQTIFEGGTLVHQRRAAVAAMQAAAAQYQSTVVSAFANVANALQALQYDATALQVALDAAHAATDSLNLLRVQFQAGSVNYLSVLTAEQTDQTALVTLARAQAARYADTVALFQALGGGWWNRDDVNPRVAQCCKLIP